MTLVRTTLAAVAASFALVAPAAPAVAATTVDLSRPAQLERGDDVRIPHLEGRTVVDGDVRIDVDRHGVELLGSSGDDYVVATWNQRGRARVERITADGASTVLLRGRYAWSPMLSDDGGTVVTSDYARRRTTLSAYDATDGDLVAAHRFRGSATVLDADAGQVLVGAWGPDVTHRWDLTSDTRSRVSSSVGYAGDLSADRLAVYTGDPYEGGCTLVTTPSGGGALWESCRQRVSTFSEDGELMATIHILSDGVGPGEVQLRETGGTVLTKYAANWFGSIEWEDVDTVLLDANGQRRGAVVRCDLDACERAGDLHRASA